MSIMFSSSKSGEKRRHPPVEAIESNLDEDLDHHRHDQEVIGSLCRLGDSSSPQEYCVDEKRVRREIANSNERRRMQSINAGFQSLRSLLPQSEGEKLSKAAILQQTTEYIYQLEQEKSRLVAQNCHLKRLVGPLKKDLLDPSISLSPEPISEVTVGSTDVILTSSTEKKDFPTQESKEKRKGMLTGEAYSRAVDRLRKEVNESRALLEAERKLRLKLEEQIHALEAQLQLQIEVPEVDASEITAHILGRKPNQPQPKLEKIQEDEDSDLIAAARNASADHKWTATTNNNNNNHKKAATGSTGPQRKNVITSTGSISRQPQRVMEEHRETAVSASSPANSSNSSDQSNQQVHQQVQFITPQGTLMTSLPAHLVLDDRPSSQPGSLLEAAMMAEPKVEVEMASRVPSPALSLAMTGGGPASPSSSSLPLSSLPVLSFQLPPHLAHLSHLATGDGSSSPITVLQHAGDVDGVTFVDIDGQLSSDSKSYLAAATSRQNLETIVEAIRHLEGDHLFNDDASCSRNGQLVQVEIDTETIGCSLVVTSAQDESGDEAMADTGPSNLQLTISEDQEVGEMITVSSEGAVADGHEEEVGTTSTETAADIIGHADTNVIVVKQM